MLTVKYQVHASRSQETGVDLIFVINRMLRANYQAPDDEETQAAHL